MQVCEPYEIHKNRSQSEENNVECQTSSDDVYERIPQ